MHVHVRVHVNYMQLTYTIVSYCVLTSKKPPRCTIPMYTMASLLPVVPYGTTRLLSNACFDPQLYHMVQLSCYKPAVPWLLNVYGLYHPRIMCFLGLRPRKYIINPRTVQPPYTLRSQGTTITCACFWGANIG